MTVLLGLAISIDPVKWVVSHLSGNVLAGRRESLPGETATESIQLNYGNYTNRSHSTAQWYNEFCP